MEETDHLSQSKVVRSDTRHPLVAIFPQNQQHGKDAWKLMQGEWVGVSGEVNEYKMKEELVDVQGVTH
jgi:hypothetical protein